MTTPRCTPTAPTWRATASATASDGIRRLAVAGSALIVAGVVAFAAAPAPAQAQAQAPAVRAGIFSCTDASGRLVRSDRPIAQCASRDQIELNRDGSVRRIVKPTPTAEEQAALEQQEREHQAAMAARNDAVRRDRLMLQKYPDEAAHNAGRARELEEKRALLKSYEVRIATLQAERKPLEEERAFYENDKVKKPLPFKLKIALDGNDAAMEAQKELMISQQAELGRINARFDADLVRLRKLWAGAPLGSVPPVVAATPARTAAR